MYASKVSMVPYVGSTVAQSTECTWKECKVVNTNIPAYLAGPEAYEGKEIEQQQGRVEGSSQVLLYID